MGNGPVVIASTGDGAATVLYTHSHYKKRLFVAG